MAPRQQGEGTREGRHAKCRWCDCHLGLRDQAASVSASVTVHMGQSDRREANSCSSSSSRPGRSAFYIMREEVGRSHAYLQEKEEEENNPSPRPLP